MFDGETNSIQESDKPKDGYVVLKPNWINSKEDFQKDYGRYSKGDFSDFYTHEAVLAPASGSMGTVSNGTTSSIKIVLGNKT